MNNPACHSKSKWRRQKLPPRPREGRSGFLRSFPFTATRTGFVIHISIKKIKNFFFSFIYLLLFILYHERENLPTSQTIPNSVDLALQVQRNICFTFTMLFFFVIWLSSFFLNLIRFTLAVSLKNFISILNVIFSSLPYSLRSLHSSAMIYLPAAWHLQNANT